MQSNKSDDASASQDEVSISSEDLCNAAHESSVQSNPASARDTDSNGMEDTKGELQHGCEHYRRRCKLVAPCCGEVFWCRHCHNDAKSENEVDPKKRHDLERKNVKELVCALCDTRQPVNQHCQHCFVTFGVYSCMECIFFDDETAKKQFHCDDCGICRGKHICVQNSMKQNCPVCFEFLFDSVRPTAVLNCGHTIHEACLTNMTQNQQMSCPICMKSYMDMAPYWQHLDAEIAVTPMPQDYANWRVDILCNDCNKPSRVQFHILGLKCSHCRSYNTRRIKLEENQAVLDARLAETAIQRDNTESAPSERHDEAVQ
ncbi:hypothetical protein WJX77_012540 [Trebouxia sp. C0004]